jgi:hypothetical protein
MQMRTRSNQIIHEAVMNQLNKLAVAQAKIGNCEVTRLAEVIMETSFTELRVASEIVQRLQRLQEHTKNLCDDLFYIYLSSVIKTLKDEIVEHAGEADLHIQIKAAKALVEIYGDALLAW